MQRTKCFEKHFARLYVCSMFLHTQVFRCTFVETNISRQFARTNNSLILILQQSILLLNVMEKNDCYNCQSDSVID